MTVYVPSQQPLSSPCRIAFVGEAPSDEELDKGRPLVGPSGRIFNALLRTAGIRREECWVGNVFNEQLPNNDVSSWCAPLPEAREGGWAEPCWQIGKAGILRPEHRHHLEWLRKDLEQVRPTVIVPLGGTALWAFTGGDQIGQSRGAVTQALSVLPGAKLVPTFHPAHVMREWKFYTVVVQDLVKAVAEAELGPEIILPDVSAVLEPTLDTLREWDSRIVNSPLLSVDIETAWGFITCIGFAPSAREALVVPFVDLREVNKSYWKTQQEEVVAMGYVKAWMEGNTPKLGQNFGAYDAFWLLDKWGIRPMNMREDTRILHHALFPELPKSLAFMGATYTDQGPWKNMRKGKGEKKED